MTCDPPAPGPSATIATLAAEQPGFVYLDSRDLTGFIDGTENPPVEEAHGVAVVAVSPGFMRTEMMLEHFGVTEANWRDGAKKDPNFIASETPSFVGRVIAALAADPHVMKKSGGLYGSWNLAKEYAITDLDGSRPDIGSQVDFEEMVARAARTTFQWRIVPR